MRLRSFAAGAAMLAAGLMPAMGHSAASLQEANYVGVIGDLTLQCSANLGGACFSLSDGTSSVTVTVDDSLSEHVGLRMDFVDEFKVRVGSVLSGCDTISAQVPAGARGLRVAVDGPVGGPAACGESLPDGTGYSGTITVLES